MEPHLKTTTVFGFREWLITEKNMVALPAVRILLLSGIPLLCSDSMNSTKQIML
jgi:hypothetical protein